jgi:hypothetical protein
MGADVADINNDGYSDVFTTDMLPEDDYRLKTLGAFDNIDVYRQKLNLGFYHQFMKNCLQVNNGDGTFSEVANYSGVSATDWSWGALIFDADNDGLNDLYVCNGVNKDVTNLDFMQFFANDVIQKMVLTGKKDKVDEVLKHIPVHPMANKVYHNKGNLQFQDVGVQWGLAQLSFSNGAAYGDLDNDGDLDLIVSNENMPCFVYRNNSREKDKNHFIGIELRGDSNNLFAIGSKVKIYSGKDLFYREFIPSRGFQSSMDYKQIIGLGNVAKIDSMVIIWPDRSCNVMKNPAVDSVYTIRKEATQKFDYAVANVAGIFTIDSVNTTFDKHIEDDYVDFYYERNIPEMLSREGPRGATADVNGDGLTDIYIGGTKEHPGQIYLQKPGSGFVKSAQKIFYQFADFEDGASVFFDADNDGDADLFVGAAGNDQPQFSRQMQGRLFINDGKGNFSVNASALPRLGVNVGAVVAADFDGDNDIDLFVGGRSVPGDYGKSPSSFILMNDGKGKFTDVAASKNPAIARIGMVSKAVVADIDGDGKNELIIVGEWMAPRIFTFEKDSFKEIKSNLNELSGWWQTVAATDVDGDGKTDLVLGNIGENFYLHPAADAPVKLWMADFDGSGDVDKVLTRKVDGKDKPVFLKNDIQDQVPGIKKQNLKHHDFALKSIQELFSPTAMSKAEVKEFNYASSIVALNKGGGNFEIIKLPYRAQLSSLNAIAFTDLNGDGMKDIVAGGNRSGFPPQLQKLDASFGDVYLNKGKGNFEWKGPQETHLKVEGEVKDIIQIDGKGVDNLLFLRNDDYPRMFRINKAQRN